MSLTDDYFESLEKGRCNPCQFARCVEASEGFRFLGCYHKPYCGKWVAEIKECPKIYEDVTE